jgi:lambda family phage portal protein
MTRAWRELQGKRSSDYKGAEMNRLLLDWVAQSLTPDEEIRGSVRKLRARARELSRNEGYAKQYLRLLTTNVIGPHGFRMQAQVMKGDVFDRETNTAIERAWLRWSEGRVTVDGTLTLRRLQKVLLRSVARDGEVFVRRWLSFDGNPFGYALQAIDADMLDENLNRARGNGVNEIRMGVEVDGVGRPLGYWFFKNPEDRVLNTGTAGRIFVTATEVLHLYDADRPNQTRGVTWLHPIMVPMKMLGGYEEAELVAARTAAAKMGFIQSPDGVGDPGDMNEPAEMEAAPGTMERLQAGETFQPWDPQHPTTAFPIFVKSLLRKISAGLGVSYNALANDLEGVNYSSMRSGLLIERDHWKDVQVDWIEDFLQPVFEDWLNMALLTGALVLDSMDATRYANEVVWKPRGWQWVDPAKDIAAIEKSIELGLTSRTKACAESGDDYEENLLNLEREERMAKEKGISIQGKPTTAPLQPPPGDPEDDDDSEESQRTLLAGRFRQ